MGPPTPLPLKVGGIRRTEAAGAWRAPGTSTASTRSTWTRGICSPGVGGRREISGFMNTWGVGGFSVAGGRGQERVHVDPG